MFDTAFNDIVPDKYQRISTLCILSKKTFSDLNLSPETCLESFGSSDVSRSSLVLLVFFKKEILTPKLLRPLSGGTKSRD